MRISWTADVGKDGVEGICIGRMEKPSPGDVEDDMAVMACVVMAVYAWMESGPVTIEVNFFFSLSLAGTRLSSLLIVILSSVWVER